jgi:hypothetical protein
MNERSLRLLETMSRDHIVDTDQGSVWRDEENVFCVHHISKSTTVSNLRIEQEMSEEVLGYHNTEIFYELTRSFLIHEKAWILLQNKTTAAVLYGPGVRTFIGIPNGSRGYASPRTNASLQNYTVFVKTMSPSKKLAAGARIIGLPFAVYSSAFKTAYSRLQDTS